MDEGALNECFPTLYIFLHENNLNLIENYFSKNDQQQNWIKDPLTTGLLSEIPISDYEQLIDLSSDSASKSKLASSSLPEFWITMKKQYPIVANKAISILIPFDSSYLCETGFSALAVIRGRLREMRIALSKFTPRFDNIIQKKQAQTFH
ncbi:Hypothetical protein CINCED_3A007429 [Cinara cedri]|uniref:HAT, C-terminal dimerisation domain n=1 Tax=Cinara cedri TaxID=506608 RepID=A0A5E4MNU0_9HEMI|nr:Hypothetical protein CINCED_3A007429 [Cinara cedri]